MSNHKAAIITPDSAGGRFLWIWWAQGVDRTHVLVLLYAAFATIGLLTFVSTGTALVLNANLDIPIAEQGRISGDLVFVTEVSQILVFGIVGVLADRIGRRGLFASGIFVMGLGYLLYPFADSVAELIAYRIIYAMGLGASTGMLGTLLADYPQDVSRGKAVGLCGILNGLGVLVVTVIMGGLLPPALIDAGFDDQAASVIVHTVVFAACAVSAVIIHFGVRKGPPADRGELVPWRTLIVSGIKEGRNPRIALSYAAAFVARSDLVILGTFIVLWGNKVAVERGIEPALAAAKGALLFAIASTAALIWIVVLGLSMDRFNRVTGLIICMTLAAIGYGSQWLVDDPLATRAIPFIVLLGVGQISAFFGATTLISQEAPRLKRGSVVGTFNMAGAIGILITAGIGGRLFDLYGGAAPFALVAVLNAIVLLLAVVVRLRAPGRMPTRSGRQSPMVES